MNESEWQIEKEDPAKPLGWCTRFFLQASPLPWLAATALLMAFVIWIFAGPAPSMIALVYPIWFFLSLVLCLPIVLAQCAQRSLSAFLRHRLGVPGDLHRSRIRFRYWFLAIFCGSWIFIYVQAPLTCAFAFSRSALDRMADEALADPENLDRFRDRWVGLYRVREAKIIGKTVVFYTGSSEIYGFARAPDAPHNQIRSSTMPKEEDLSRSSDFHFRDFPMEDDTPEFSMRDIVGERLSGDWFVFYSSYMQVKLGWS